MSLEVTDLEEIGSQAVNEFRGTLAAVNESGVDGAVQRMLAKLEIAYGVAARIAHHEETLEGTERVWAAMVDLCDRTTKELNGLRAPSKAAVDRVLDFRNAAERRRELHS